MKFDNQHVIFSIFWINVFAQDIKSLRAIREENKLKNFICVCLEKRSREVDGITILPYGKFLSSLWLN